MPDASEHDPRLPKSNAGCLFLLIPIALSALVVLAYIVLFAMGTGGRPAEGEVIRVAFAGCDEARPIVEARVAAMGLGAPSFEDTSEGFALTARFPDDPGTAAAIPQTLARRGWIEARSVATGAVVVDSSRVAEVTLTLALTGEPELVVQLDRDGALAIKAHLDAAPGDALVVAIDGAPLGEPWPVAPASRIQVESAQEDLRASIEEMSEASIVLGNGPLPCALVATPGPPAP